MIDMAPATDRLGTLVRAVRDEQLGAPTPCPEMTLGDLLDHVDGLAAAFAAAARKDPAGAGRQGASSDASHLGDDWRDRIPQRLDAMAGAWSDDDAWTGTTEAGGLEMPGEVAGSVATNEVVVHGWDVAVASGQPYAVEPVLVEAALRFVGASVAEAPDGTPGLFGPPVPVPDGASPLERLVALTGRDPAWRPPTP